MAETSVARPALALHAAIEFRFDPASPMRTGRHGTRPLRGCQAFFQFDGLGSGEPPRKLAYVAQPVLTRRGNAKTLDAGAARLITDDDARHHQRRLDFRQEGERWPGR
jgi:hypothetical protein